MSQPMIDSARLQFSGLSAEDFEVPAIGEERTYTIIAVCQSHNERAMANEGTRKSANMKVVRVLSGVDKSIEEPPADEPSLFDQPPADEPEPEPEGDDEDQGDEVDNDDAIAEYTGNVTSIGPSFADGPQFSAGDGE